MEKEKFTQMLEQLLAQSNGDFLARYRAYSTLATMIEGNVTINDIANGIADRFNTLSPFKEINLCAKDIVDQLLNSDIMKYLEESHLIIVQNNRYALTGEGILIGYAHYLHLKEIPILPEILLKVLSVMVFNSLNKNLEPNTLFDKEELIKLFIHFKENILTPDSIH